jgi:hypothetical protein
VFIQKLLSRYFLSQTFIAEECHHRVFIRQRVVTTVCSFVRELPPPCVHSSESCHHYVFIRQRVATTMCSFVRPSLSRQQSSSTAQTSALRYLCCCSDSSNTMSRSCHRCVHHCAFSYLYRCHFFFSNRNNVFSFDRLIHVKSSKYTLSSRTPPSYVRKQPLTDCI